MVERDFSFKAFKKALSRFIDVSNISLQSIESKDSKVRASYIVWNCMSGDKDVVKLNSSYYPYPLNRFRVASLSSKLDHNYERVISERLEMFDSVLDYAQKDQAELGFNVSLEDEDKLRFEIDSTGVVYYGDTTNPEAIEEIILGMPLIGKKMIITHFDIIFGEFSELSVTMVDVMKVLESSKQAQLINCRIEEQDDTRVRLSVSFCSEHDISLDADFINSIRADILNYVGTCTILYKGTSYVEHGNGFGGLSSFEWTDSDIFDTKIVYPNLSLDNNVGVVVSVVEYKGVCCGLSSENVFLVKK